VAGRQAKGPPAQTAAVTRTEGGTLKGSGKTHTSLRPNEVGGTSFALEEAVLMNLQNKGELVATVSIPTDVSAADLIAQVTERWEAARMTPGETSDLLFPFLFDGTVSDRRKVHATLKRFATPEAILDTALRTHNLQGHECYLNEAASLLADFGAAAWPAIRRWAQLGGPICESLVETAFSVEGVPDAEYLAGLKDLISKGDHNTRSRALSALHLVPERFHRDLLIVMAVTGDRDDPSREEAQERRAEKFA
jgi:hypothetical protein